ncbi:RagB/SusD family nutrient uptake outer membrane protein [Bacteroidaceae bacterium HV4-6-C5C]|nr:RagB/SusD family nutrient uptake outer membrane protein [Bacteroidaceae bacterium HV4-6-C5C]
MKISSHELLLIALSGFTTMSCSNSDKGEDLTPHTYNVSGKVEKGPFVSGSTITIQPMDSKLQVLGSMFNTTITDNTGSFTFGSKVFQAPYAEIMATGYFFNEVKGNLSNGVLVLRALVDLSDNSTVNVNILTHLKYSRIKKLIESGKSFKEANNQAQSELLKQFGLQRYASKDVSQFSIVAGTDESAALIAVSSLLLINRGEGTLTEYLSTLSQEFGENGSFSDMTKAQIKKDKLELASYLNIIHDNVIKRYADLGMNIEVKNLASYFDWDDDGTAGNETLKDGEHVTLDKTEISVPKDGGLYQVTINSPIPVYTEESISGSPSTAIGDNNFLNSIYDSDVSATPTVEKKIENKILTIKVGKSQSKKEQMLAINLFDCIGNTVATVNLKIEANSTATLPLLGNGGKAAMNSIVLSLSDAFSQYNIIEQYYYYNKDMHVLPLSSSDNYISNCWTKFYSSNNYLLFFKEYESQQLGIYQDYFNVFYAMYYYTMVVAWGDVPYNYGNRWTDISDRISRIPKEDILSDLKSRLKTAIENLDEKKNHSLTDINGMFFVSKDVARILLANIYMYEENWSSAKTLLAKVISNGYYGLDGTSDYEKTGNGIIFGFSTEENTKSTKSSSATIKTPSIMPIQSISDAYLLNAECEYHLGNTNDAKALLSKVTSAKGITVSSDILTGIKEARAKELLYNAGYFAFLKRNGLATSESAIQSYELLFPIPRRELDLNPSMTQNPGY